MRIIQSENPRPLNLLAVGPNGLIAAASNIFESPGEVEVWNIASGSRLEADRSQLGFAALAYDATGEHLIFSVPEFGFTIFGVGTSPGRDWAINFVYTQFALFPDATRLLVASSLSAGNIFQCWKVNPDWSFERLWGEEPRPYHSFHAPAVSPNGTKTVVADRYDGTDGRPRQEISLRDADTGKVRVTIPLDPTSPVHQLAFTADGAKFLIRTDSNKVHLFDTATGAPAGELAHRGRPFVTGMAVHPRGPVACARTDGTVTFWDVEKREQIRTLDWKTGRLVSVAFSPDGSLAAAGTEDGKIVVWDVDL